MGTLPWNRRRIGAVILGAFLSTVGVLAARWSLLSWARSDCWPTSRATEEAAKELLSGLRGVIHRGLREDMAGLASNPEAHRLLEEFIQLGPEGVPVLREKIRTNLAYRALCRNRGDCSHAGCILFMNFLGQLDEDGWLNAYLEEAIFRIQHPGERRGIQDAIWYTLVMC